MTQKITRHLQHYLPLLGIFVVGVIGFTYFSYDTNFQAAIAIGMAAAYISWGVVHHYIHRDLHTSVFVEYAIIALLGLTIVFTILFRS